MKTKQGELILWLTSEHREMIWTVRQKDPTIIDSIGFSETSHLAVGRFDQEAEAYFSLWNETPGRYDKYYLWLKALKSQVTREVRWLWRRRGGWFDRVALPKVDAELDAAITIWRNKAHVVELRRHDTAKPEPTETPAPIAEISSPATSPAAASITIVDRGGERN
jgi:hypothetical protein